MHREESFAGSPVDAEGVGMNPAEAEGASPPAPQEAEATSSEALEGGALAELRDRYLRLAADLDNVRRRHAAELAERGARAQADLLGRIVDSLDDLRRVASLDPSTVSSASLAEGVLMVERKLLKELVDAGAEVLDPESGAGFDPESMEAVTIVPAGSEGEDDQVAQVFQRGFRMRGILVRPARVAVRKHD